MLISGADSYLLLFMAPLLLFYKFHRAIFILLALEYMSLLILACMFSTQPSSMMGVTGVFLVLSCLVMEASVGIGLLVSLVRWGGKLQAMSA